MKISFIVLIIILTLGVVVAGGITISNIDVSFNKTVSTVNYINGTVTFLCGKRPMSINIREVDKDIDDDFEKKVSIICNETISGAVDWLGRKYQSNVYGLRSFDQDKLNKDYCDNLGQIYDYNLKKCNQKVVLINIPNIDYTKILNK